MLGALGDFGGSGRRAAHSGSLPCAIALTELTEGPFNGAKCAGSPGASYRPYIDLTMPPHFVRSERFGVVTIPLFDYRDGRLKLDVLRAQMSDDLGDSIRPASASMRQWCS